ncbi:uncharacterized protein LOC143180221 [Calliopsis andreniformis]|uniref:uncharacterized protein LOC143180221 n=1 Tax=Calliopsis andreniformis TaxID=337506 RepID=UPI003FCCC424
MKEIMQRECGTAKKNAMVLSISLVTSTSDYTHLIESPPRSRTRLDGRQHGGEWWGPETKPRFSRFSCYLSIGPRRFAARSLEIFSKTIRFAGETNIKGEGGRKREKESLSDVPRQALTLDTTRSTF